MQNLNRWVLRGKLTLLSPMALRTGGKEGEEAAGKDPIPKGAQGPIARDGRAPGEVLAITLDHDAQPVIPGSSLKGVLRSYIAPRADPTIVKSLFGDYAREPKPGDALREFLLEDDGLRDAKVSVGGKAEFCEARLAGYSSSANDRADVADYPCVGRTAIDAETRTADAGMLRHERTVSAGTVFEVDIRADGVSADEIDVLLAALNGFNELSTAPITLGSGRGGGCGRATWELTALHEIDAKAIAAWLAETPPRHWTMLLEDRSAKQRAKDRAKTKAGKTALGDLDLWR